MISARVSACACVPSLSLSLSLCLCLSVRCEAKNLLLPLASVSRRTVNSQHRGFSRPREKHRRGRTRASTRVTRSELREREGEVLLLQQQRERERREKKSKLLSLGDLFSKCAERLRRSCTFKKVTAVPDKPFSEWRAKMSYHGKFWLSFLLS